MHSVRNTGPFLPRIADEGQWWRFCPSERKTAKYHQTFYTGTKETWYKNFAFSGQCVAIFQKRRSRCRYSCCKTLTKSHIRMVYCTLHSRQLLMGYNGRDSYTGNIQAANIWNWNNSFIHWCLFRTKVYIRDTNNEMKSGVAYYFLKFLLLYHHQLWCSWIDWNWVTWHTIKTKATFPFSTGNNDR